ncbi:MAG: hypothetical protein A2Y60_03145 [Chloroflexi bacterium RBG_13_54_9]|nr:MAG: hypothetical protein A2Y60_03145 [Chloroflexi bacterium RBG_13_54_9]
MEVLLGALQWLRTVAGGVFTLLVLGITGAPIVLVVGLIGIRLGSSLASRVRRKAAMACSTDADCPTGYVCVGGICVAATSE